MRTALRLVLAYLGIALIPGLMWAIQSYPDLPGTAPEWLTIFALALPAQLLLEFVGERVWNNKATRFVEQTTAASSFSLLRIAYGILLALAVMGLLFGAAQVWRAMEAPIGA